MSASVGSSSFASCQDTLITGRRPLPQPSVARAMLAAAVRHTGVPLRERHLELAHGERPLDGHLALRTFVAGAARLARAATPS